MGNARVRPAERALIVVGHARLLRAFVEHFAAPHRCRADARAAAATAARFELSAAGVLMVDVEFGAAGELEIVDLALVFDSKLADATESLPASRALHVGKFAAEAAAAAAAVTSPPMAAL